MFESDARASGTRSGMPGIRIVPETVPSECSVQADIQAGVTKAFDAIVTALTKAPTADETNPKPVPVETQGVILTASYADVDKFFYVSGWTDGLPIVPPTEAAVAEMMTGTDLAPDFKVCDLLILKGYATVKKIATCAVMAGCLPTYMPLLIAGVECMNDPASMCSLLSTSAGSWGALWIVNGPVRDQLDINYSTGILGTGWKANKAMARAFYLIQKTIGGSREQVECMASTGSPWGKSLLVAENEEISPWEPLSVAMGFKKEDTTIEVQVPNLVVQCSPYGTDANGIIQAIISNFAPTRNSATIMITGDNANQLAKAGWTRKSLTDHLIQNLVVPANQHPDFYAASPSGVISTSVSKDPNAPMRIIQTAVEKTALRIFVAGGPTMMSIFEGGSTTAIKKAQLPKNWNALVEKYKAVKFRYIAY